MATRANGKPVAAHPLLLHRGGLATQVPALRPSQDLGQRLGGSAVVTSFVRGLYERIDRDALLRPLFPRNLAPGAQRSVRFFDEWLGGPARWNTYRGLVDRHREPITRAAAGRWVKHLEAALASAQVPANLAGELLAVARPIAMALVHDPAEESVSLACPKTYVQPARLAARGDLAGIADVLDSDPRFRVPSGTGIQIMLFHAARKGRTAAVEYLLERGADAALPDGSHTFLPISSFAIARKGGHTATADALLAAGAPNDILDAAYLGDLERIEYWLSACPELSTAHDPAHDFVDATALEHAQAGHQVEAARRLLEAGARPQSLEPILDSKQALAFAELLIEYGASAAGLQPGSWVLDQPLAELLFAHGADFRTSGGEWIEYCTRHHGNTESPDLIRAFLEHGVDPNARTEKQRTALHCAVRVGFQQVAQLLIEAGADLEARDEGGATPLAYVEQAGKSVDRPSMRRFLLEHGAQPLPSDQNPKG